jgi:spermidine/putrescine-binding protein
MPHSAYSAPGLVRKSVRKSPVAADSVGINGESPESPAPNRPQPDYPRSSRYDLSRLTPEIVMGRLARGEITRRDVFRVLSAVGLASFGMSMFEMEALASDELKMIIWQGYADDSYRLPFEEANDCTISATDASTGDDMLARMQSGEGKNYDLVSASSDLPRRLYDANLLAEIDTTKLTNYADLWDQFKSPDYITFDTKLYGVNFAWSPTLLIANGNAIRTPPTSWDTLLDQQYQGKIATWNYPLQIAQYALLLDPAPEDPYTLTDDQLAAVKDILVRQRPLIGLYWNTGLELADAFVNNEIVVADGWPWISRQIRTQGGNPIESIPQEGVTGWSDSWVISRNTKNYDLALKWADWMISPEGQIGLTEAMDYSITNRVAAETLSDRRQQELHLTNVTTDYEKIKLWKHVENFDKWVQVWNEATQG